MYGTSERLRADMTDRPATENTVAEPATARDVAGGAAPRPPIGQVPMRSRAATAAAGTSSTTVWYVSMGPTIAPRGPVRHASLP